MAGGSHGLLEPSPQSNDEDERKKDIEVLSKLVRGLVRRLKKTNDAAELKKLAEEIQQLLVRFLASW